jgi:SAM-dependent methyltransferase
MSVAKKEWFGEWFDSPYYHLLYKHRNEHEAAAFIDVLADKLHFQPTQQLLDLACGKGRHSIYLNAKGLDVCGVDLSPSNIATASAHANARLRFLQKDMRTLDFREEFDVVLNLFTSFGYFDTQEEHLQVFRGVYRALRPGGMFVLDFLNPELVLRKLVSAEVKQVDGVDFHIRREAVDGYIRKHIEFSEEGRAHHYTEKVKAITKEEFEHFFAEAGFRLEACYGDYQLGVYDACCSERMIFVARKP